MTPTYLGDTIRDEYHVRAALREARRNEHELTITMRYQHGNSDKFYQVMQLYRDGDWRYRVKWGRSGTEGTSQRVNHQTALDRIRSKLHKGYVVEQVSYEDAASNGKAAQPRLTLADRIKAQHGAWLPVTRQDAVDRLLTWNAALDRELGPALVTGADRINVYRSIDGAFYYALVIMKDGTMLLGRVEQ